MDPKKKRYTKYDVQDPSEKQPFLSEDKEKYAFSYNSGKYKYDSKKPDYSHKSYERVPTDDNEKTYPKWK